MQPINITLSTKSVHQARLELERIRNNIPTAMDNARLELAQLGRDRAEMFLATSDGTSTIKGSMKVSHGGSSTSLYTDIPWAVYVEYGTGIVGEQSPHPVPETAGWVYDINNHGVAGWWYVIRKGAFWTQGQIGSAFLYTTGQWLVTQAPQVVGKHIKGLRKP